MIHVIDMMGYDRARLPVAAIRFERPVVIGRPKLALMGGSRAEGEFLRMRTKWPYHTFHYLAFRR